jgi:tripartite-type tricarboxylate transporter receptor subunit TctC
MQRTTPIGIILKMTVLNLCALSAVLVTSLVHAEDSFPKRSVTIVVPYSAGGVTDYFARQIGFKLSKFWGQPVIVDNRAGGGTVIGTQMVSKAPADGYTLLFTSYGFTTNEVLRKDLPYSPSALRPIALLGSSHNVLLVTNRLRDKSLKDMLEGAKATPGSLKLASSGIGSSPHIAAEQFAQKTGVDFIHVPYKGQGPAMSDLIAGIVDGMFDGMSSYAQVKGGRVRAVAIAAMQRHPAAPEIPTFKELGVDLVSGTWFGLFAPAATPPLVVTKINADMRAALQGEELKAQIEKTGLSILTSSAADFEEFLNRESANLQGLVDRGAKIDLH